MIQVRDVSDRLHRELTRRARRAGLTLTDYVQRILEREIARPPAAEVLERVATRLPVDLGASAAEVLRSERARRKRS
jgi:hypothetical protein